MSDHDRLDRLEQRLLRLEKLMRRVLQALPTAIEEAPAAPPAAAAPAEPVASLAGPRVAPPPPKPLVTPAAPRPTFDGEQWMGQRGLLAVGVVAVVLAAGYLLKLSFDRGWISPFMRCVGGVVVGLGVAIGGWSIERRGYRTYGPALVGTGAAILYLTVWAASRLYGFVPPMSGIGVMALVALALAAAAWEMNAEPLAAVAAVGAFLAPLVIGQSAADADLLLGYLAAIGFALGVVAWAKEWRLTGLLIGISYFGFGLLAADDAGPFMALAFGAAGGGAGLALGLKYNWWELRFLSFWGGWGCLVAAQSERTAPLVLLAGLALSFPVWEHALRRDGVWPFAEQGSGRGVLPSFYFYVTPFWLSWAVSRLGYGVFTTHLGLATAAVAAAYLAIALTGLRRPFAIVATLGALVATTMEWPRDLNAAGVLGVLAVAWGMIARITRRRDWNYHAVIAVASGLVLLWTDGLQVRPFDGPAFIDRWALVLWGLLVVTVALATDLAALGDEDPPIRRSGLWGLAGMVLLFGVTVELTRFFRLRSVDPAAAMLAGGLSVSVWWLLFAGGCILLGFRRGLRPLRVAGLWVSGLAVLKVVFIDLSQLDALYRVGSVFGLGLVSLLVAWSYHRRARLEANVTSER